MTEHQILNALDACIGNQEDALVLMSVISDTLAEDLSILADELSDSGKIGLAGIMHESTRRTSTALLNIAKEAFYCQTEELKRVSNGLRSEDMPTEGRGSCVRF